MKAHPHCREGLYEPGEIQKEEENSCRDVNERSKKKRKNSCRDMNSTKRQEKREDPAREERRGTEKNRVSRAVRERVLEQDTGTCIEKNR